MLWEIFAYPYLRFWWPCTNQEIVEKEKSLFDKPWIDNHLRHLMRVRYACFIKYCRAKKAREKKLKIHAEYKVLRNEVKMKTKQAKKNITRIYSKKSKWEEKVNVLHAP